jgi:hypothetical protein
MKREYRSASGMPFIALADQENGIDPIKRV